MRTESPLYFSPTAKPLEIRKTTTFFALKGQVKKWRLEVGN
jgi:hypothetical protein